MTIIQERLLCLIREIDQICKKYQIPYYLSGGCVIGALRHKGFIPWDDDIDILLESKYWKQFYDAFQKEMPLNRMLGCIENNINFPNMIYRYCDTSTTEIHKNELFGDSTAGIVVDIILMDSIDSTEIAQKSHMKNLLLFSDIVNVYYSYNLRFKIDIPYRRYLLLTKILGKRRILTRLEKKLRAYENQNCDYYMVRWPAGPSIFPKDIFGTPRYVEFEGIFLPIPEKAGRFLREIYGDEWVEVPNPDQQNTHNTILDMEREYQEYFRQYVPRIGYKKAVKKYQELKKHFIKTKYMQNDDSKSLWRLEGLKEKYLIEKKIRQEKLNPILMFENKEYKALEMLFKDYMLRQGSGDFLGGEFWEGLTRRYDPVYIDLGDEYLSIILWLWIRQGRVAKAYKVLRARELAKKEKFSTELQKVSDFIDEMRAAVDLYEFSKYEQSLRLVKDLIEKSSCVIVNLWKLRIRLERKLTNNNREQEELWLEEFLAIFPNDGELLKYKTDIDYAQNGIEKTYLRYAEAFDKTRNGIVWMEIKEIFQQEIPWVFEQLEKLMQEKKYDVALCLSETWMKYIEDCKDLEYYYCKSLCFSKSETLTVENEVMQYICKYPEDSRFREVLQEVLLINGKRTDYLDYRIRMYSVTENSEYEEIKQSLLEDKNEESLDKLELLAQVYRILGEKSKEFESYRDFLDKGGKSDTVDIIIEQDMNRMILGLYAAKTRMMRENMVAEWKMKYMDAKISTKYLLKYNVFPQELEEELEEWLQKMLTGEQVWECIEHLHKEYLIYRNIKNEGNPRTQETLMNRFPEGVMVSLERINA